MKIARTTVAGIAVVGSLINSAAAGSQGSGNAHSSGKKPSPPADVANPSIIHPIHIATHTTDIDLDSWRASSTSIPSANSAKPLHAREISASEPLSKALTILSTAIETVIHTAIVTVFDEPPSTSAHYTRKFTVTAPQPVVTVSVTASRSSHTTSKSTVTASVAVATKTEIYHLGGYFEKVFVDGSVMEVPAASSTTFTRIETLVGHKNHTLTTTRTLTEPLAPSGPYNGYDCSEEPGRFVSCLWPGNSPASSMCPEATLKSTKVHHQDSSNAHQHSATLKARSEQTAVPFPPDLSYAERVNSWQALVSSPEWPKDAHPYMKAPGAPPADCSPDVPDKLYRIHLAPWDQFSIGRGAESRFYSQKAQTSAEVDIPLTTDSLALINGTFINQHGYVGGIVANDQLQWDRPSQSGTRWNSGFCMQTLYMVENANLSNNGPVSRLALGDRLQFWTCNHDEALAKLYWSQVNMDCQPVMVALDQVWPPVGAPTSAASSSNVAVSSPIGTFSTSFTSQALVSPSTLTTSASKVAGPVSLPSSTASTFAGSAASLSSSGFGSSKTFSDPTTSIYSNYSMNYNFPRSSANGVISVTSSTAATTTGWVTMTINGSIQAAVPATKPIIIENDIFYSASPTVCTVKGTITTDHTGVPISTVVTSALLGKPIKRQASATDAEGQHLVGDTPTQRYDILTTGTATVAAQTVTDYDDASSATVYTFPEKVVHYTNVPILPAGKAALFPGAAIAPRQEQDDGYFEIVTVIPTSTLTTTTSVYDLPASTSTVSTAIKNDNAEEPSTSSEITTAQQNSTTTSSLAFAPTTQVVVTTEVTNLTITSKPGATYTTRTIALATGLSELCEIGQMTGCQPLYDPKTLANDTMPPFTSFNATGLPTLPSTVTSTKVVEPTMHSSGPTPSVSPSPSADQAGKVEVVGVGMGMGLLGAMAFLLG
ncbi:hypothetical protein AC579_956 [Pseudocercospora musae]|uniref:Cell wall mannoprotein PIR1-like C-terminal domain-containing protein n=1 Tax=Pseudocercospora musae TaxID=113226 RepID=A0A139IU85_9PEZI|nr:hypothetical protein AC579_956 [Pseudocercospora musae]KXT18316.1 hypothetical protein AC579_956 [Pseudocercospora musae]KXT18317.1 hypothetical protein AC579_956 [Pseudocercospora musae]